MDPNIERPLKTDSLVDLTATGRKSGDPHRIEIAFHDLDGAIYISGLPGQRDGNAKVLASPRITFHLKQNHQADLPAEATPVLDAATREMVLSRIVAQRGRQKELASFLEGSPLIRIEILGENEAG